MIRAALIDAERLVWAYAAAAERIPDVRITAATGSDQATLRQTLGDVFTARSLAELVERHGSEFDAVLIHSPPSDRSRQVVEAAAAGKSILVELPLATSTTAACQAVAACRAAGVRLDIAALERWTPYAQSLRQNLDAAKLGQPGFLRIHHWHSDPLRGLARGAPSTGHLVEAICGELDLACWLFDAAPEKIFADAWGLDQTVGPAALHIHLGFPGGGMALIDTADLGRPGAQPYRMLTLIGSRGAAYADDHHNVQLVRQHDATHAVLASQGCEYLRRQLEAFVRAAEQGGPPSCSAVDVIRSIAVAEAAAECIHQSGAVRRLASQRIDENVDATIPEFTPV